MALGAGTGRRQATPEERAANIAAREARQSRSFGGRGGIIGEGLSFNERKFTAGVGRQAPSRSFGSGGGGGGGSSPRGPGSTRFGLSGGGGGGSGGGGGGGGRLAATSTSGGGFDSKQFQKLFSSFQNQQTSFNAGQAKRFKNLQKMAKTTRKRTLKSNKKALKEARKVGKSAKLDLQRQGTRAVASSQQSLINRGLGNTSIVEQQQRAIGEDVSRQSRAIDEDVSRRRTGILENRAGLELNLGRLGIDTALSRTDQIPNLSDTLRLLSQLGGGF